MKFKDYLLNEKTFSISGDVDFLYKTYFKKHIKLFKKNKLKEFLNDIKKHFHNGKIIYGVISSNELKSLIIKKANKTNPVFINMGIYPDGSYYMPFNNKISISINDNAINLLTNGSLMSFDEVKKKLFNNETTFKRWKNEFSEAALKGTIYHELSHWLNDTLHNKNITNRLNKVKETNNLKFLNNGSDVNFTDFELDAQVHAIKQLKRSYRKNWDNITWFDIAQLKPSFYPIFQILKKEPKNIKDKYMKTILSRVNKEKLLGKNMENSFYSALNKIK